MTMNIALSRMQPYSGEHNSGVDTSTLAGKVMCGYQGWFSAQGDGSNQGWFHYAERHELLAPGHCTFDLWPDMSELDADEKFATPFTHPDGSTAYLFSPYNRKTVMRHFKWMKEYGIDGVFLQRYGVSIKAPKDLDYRNTVTSHVQAGANQYGRTWAVMYDLSGLQAGEIKKYVIEDWKRLIDRMKIREDKSYLHHKGGLVVGVWGVGFSDNRKYSLAECDELVDFFKNDPAYGGNTVLLGVPTKWRTLNSDALEDEKLHEIIGKADIVSPWVVTRFNSPEAAARHGREVMKPDIEWTEKHNKDYLPVIFPGFSWQNLYKTLGKNSPLNQIPRLKGEFLWSQAVAAKQAGAQMVYVAMFDEIDEGTAIFKCTNNPPVGESNFLTYEGLPSDHYLWLTGKVGELLRNENTKTRMPQREATPQSDQ